MRPARRAPRLPANTTHSRSNSSALALGAYGDENAISLVGPQRTQAGIGLAHKASSSNILSRTKASSIKKEAMSSAREKLAPGKEVVGRAAVVASRRVLGEVGSNTVKTNIAMNPDAEAKLSLKPCRSRNPSSATAPSSSGLSNAFAKGLKVGSSATLGGIGAKRVAAGLKTRASSHSLRGTAAAERKGPARSQSASNVAGQGAEHRPSESHVESLRPKGEDRAAMQIEHQNEPRHPKISLPDSIFAAAEAENKANTSGRDLLEDDAGAAVIVYAAEANELSMCKSDAAEMQETNTDRGGDNWLLLDPSQEDGCRQEVQNIRREFQEELDYWDTTMVAEYTDEIFSYMESIEEDMLPNPCYMDAQTEVEWEMRGTLIDWLLQVHMRYHMLPETLWIAVNLMDRFLSKRVVSLVKLQLVGVTSMFVAAKYEEIMAPSVEEFVYMTENGYSRDEILRGERIILTTLDFNVSPYCSPYSWLRRISKADDYDIQTRTLSKFLMEVTLIDHRFLRAKPSMIAAIGMYTARRMLGGDWNTNFVYYSNYAEAQLMTPFLFLIEILAQPGFKERFVFKKYDHKKFLKASTFACSFANRFIREHRF